MNDSGYRPKSSLPELSWTTALLLVAGVMVVGIGAIALLRSAEDDEPSPSAKVVAPVKAPAKVPKKASREVEELRQKLDELERQHQVQESDQEKTAQAAVELLAQALRGGQRIAVEEPPVELTSGPFTKVSSTIAQVTFSLSNPGRRLARVPARVKLYRDGLEVGTKTQLFEIGGREIRAYSVLFQVSGAGSYAASIDLTPAD